MSNPSLQNEERHSRFELRTLLETSRLLIESHDMDFVLNNLLLITMGKLLVTRATVLIHQPASDVYRIRKSKGRGSPAEHVTVNLDWGEEAKSRSVIQPGEEGLELPDELSGEGPCIFFNLRTSNNHLGYLCLGAKGTRQPLNRHETEFVESLCIISSVAIANSRMFTELRRINRELDRKVYELKTLFDLSKDFNMMVDREEIIRVFKFAMLGQMLIRKFFFVLEYEEERKVVASSGTRGELSGEEIEYLYNLDEELTEVDVELQKNVPFLAENEIEAVIGLQFQNERAALVGVGARANEESYSASDFQFLRSLGNLTLLSIQKTFLLEERIEKERLEEEVNIAKNIQQGLLPDPIPDCDKLEIAAANLSSYQVGGDYYDILETPDRHLLFAIGDVTGKGIPAALLMANLQAMLHVLLPVDITLSEASGRVNDIIYRNTPSDKFITFFWGIFNPGDATFRYVNAGHNPPLLLRGGSEDFRELSEGGLILGAMPTMEPYEEKTISLASDDLLIFYTDGVTEAMNEAEDEEYGEQRLLDCIRNNRRKSPSELLDVIVEDINRFSGGVQHDDVTLIIYRVL